MESSSDDDNLKLGSQMGQDIYNRRAIEEAGTCGCLRCAVVMKPEEIEEWQGDITAICPNCLSNDVVALFFDGTDAEKLSLVMLSQKLTR